jgi:hypothetical protein
MICTKKFWAILIITLLLLFFGVYKAHVMASEPPKYPYVERVEVGYKIQPFEFSDSIVPFKENKALKIEKEKEDTEYKDNIIGGLVISLCLYIFAAFTIVLVLLTLASFIIALAKFQNKYAKKR